MSLRLIARAFRPRLRGGIAPRRKWAPSTCTSHVASHTSSLPSASAGPPAAFSTATSSPMPTMTSGPGHGQRRPDPLDQSELAKLLDSHFVLTFSTTARRARAAASTSSAATMAETTAIPAAPASIMAAAFSVVMPPMATTGTFTAFGHRAAALRCPAGGGASGFVGVEKTGLAPM